MAGETTTSYSMRAEQAKLDAVRGIREKITKTVIDKWWQTHPEKGAPEPSSYNVQQEVDKLINTPPGPDGTTPKYVTYGGEQVPTARTIDEYGNVAAKSVDQGTQVMGSSFLGMLWTALRAFFDWMSTGFTGSFAESYTRITTNDISQAYERNLGDMGQDKEHSAFIATHDILNVGKAKIANAVQVAAGRAPADAEAPFDIDTYKRPEKKPETNYANAVPATGTPQEKIGGLLTAAIGATKEQFKDELKALPEAQKKQIEELEIKLLENGKKLAADPKAPATAAAFSEQLIKQTCKDCGINLGPDADRKSLREIIDQMSHGTKEQQQQAMLITKLDSELQNAHPHMRVAAGAKPPSAAELKQQEAEKQKRDAETSTKLAGSVKGQVKNEVTKAIDETIRHKVGEEVSKTAKEWNVRGTRAARLKAVTVFDKYKGRTPTGYEKSELDAATNSLVEFAAYWNKGPSDAQIKKISALTGEAVADTVAANPRASQAELAAAIEANVLKKLQENQGEIDRLGTPLSDIKKNSNMDVFREVATGLGDAVRTNKDGAYDKLKPALNTLANAQIGGSPAAIVSALAMNTMATHEIDIAELKKTNAQLVRSVDTNRDNKISRAEGAVLLNQLPVTGQKELKTIRDMIAKLPDNLETDKTIEAFNIAIDQHLTSRDANKDGKVQFSEIDLGKTHDVMAMAKQMIDRSNATQADKDRDKAVVDTLLKHDKNRDGKISLEEALNAMPQSGLPSLSLPGNKSTGANKK